jgi:hypothetical protein
MAELSPAGDVRRVGLASTGKWPRLDGVQFGVLGLRDTTYAEFCATGRKDRTGGENARARGRGAG